jgi:hypothetical protein
MFTYHTFRATGRYKYRLCLTWILHDKEKVHNTTMQASRSCATMMLISLCAVALLLLPPASAELDKWPADSPAEAPVQGTEAQGKADDGGGAAGGRDAKAQAAPPRPARPGGEAGACPRGSLRPARSLYGTRSTRAPCRLPETPVE